MLVKSTYLIISLAALWSKFASPHVDCGTPHPKQVIENDEAEIHMYGKTVRTMSQKDLSSMFQAILKKSNNPAVKSTAYKLVGMPIVFHILPHQDNGSLGRPSLTNHQRDFAVYVTNQLYRIYDKKSKTSVQFASFVTSQTIVHTNITVKADCPDLSESLVQTIVTQADEWQFKLHVIVCETSQFSGLASFPSNYDVTSPFHNLVFIDYRAFACHDEKGNFLCNLTKGKKVSHTRWWRTRSTVVSHEIGHLLGLLHTFEGGCNGGDGVSDTPFSDSHSTSGCPGLLPYDRNRDLYSVSGQKRINKGNNATCKAGSGVCASGTCAACCTPKANSTACTKYSSEFESVPEGVNKSPYCCFNPTPTDSCVGRAGIDPLNNVMSYIPDFCSYEFTPGQLARMMSQSRTYKDYMYCNYANIVDVVKCAKVPCASTATSPNCK